MGVKGTLDARQSSKGRLQGSWPALAGSYAGSMFKAVHARTLPIGSHVWSSVV